MRIGIDLGGTKITGGIIGISGIVTARSRVPTNRDGGREGITRQIIDLIYTILRESNTPITEIERIGIAAAGQIDGITQSILFSPNLPGFFDVPLKSVIEEETGIPAFIENDVNAATYGEWYFGLGAAPRDVVGVFLGTGIGGGLILNGKLYRGCTGVGGEIGHMTINPDGYPCNCGNRGCFEAYCGGSYIVERVARRIRDGYRGTILSVLADDVESLHAGHIEEAYRLGDDLCKNVWEEVIEFLGAGLAGLVNILNPEVIILGGGVIFGTKSLMDDAQRIMEKRAMAASLKGLRVVKATLGEDAAILGAAFVE